MAKKKEEQEVKKKGKSYEIDEKYSSQVIKEYGNVFKNGVEICSEGLKKRVIPFSPAHDLALGGGLMEGFCAIINGPPKLGKTSSALHFAAKAQKPENGSRRTVYLDIECRLKPMNLTGYGIDLEMIDVISPDGKVIDGETYLTILEKILKDNKELVVIVDSISELLSKSEAEGEISGDLRAKMPKVCYNFFRRIAPLVSHNNHIVIFIGHIVADMSMSRKTKTATGGNAMQYRSDTTIEGLYAQQWEVGGKIIGQFINWKVVCSAAGGIPHTQYVSSLRFGEGIDEVQEVLPILCDLSIIEKSGAWFYIGEGENRKSFQGQEKVSNFLKENPEVFKELTDKLAEIYRKDIYQENVEC